MYQNFRRDLSRQRHVKKLYVFVCEDTASVVDYLNELGSFYQLNMKVTSAKHSNLNAIHEKAKNCKERLEGKRVPFELICCVDLDENRDVDLLDFIEKNNEKAIETSLMFPCFEIWFIQYFETCSRLFAESRHCIDYFLRKFNTAFKTHDEVESIKSRKDLFQKLNERKNVVEIIITLKNIFKEIEPREVITQKMRTYTNLHYILERIFIENKIMPSNN